MHTPSIYLATVAVLATIASAEGERPKFYFPRQVKRQLVVNTTLAPEKTKQDPFTSFSTKRSLTDFLNGLTTGDSSPSSAGTTGGLLDGLDGILSPVSPTSSSDDTKPASDSNSNESKKPKTTSRDGLDLSNILDPLLGPTGLIPDIIVKPTTTKAPTKPVTTLFPGTDSAITFGPGGIFTRSTDSDDTKSTKDEGLLPGLNTFLSTLLSPKPTSSDESDAATKTVTSDDPEKTDFLSSLLGGLISSKSESSDKPTKTPTSDEPATTDFLSSLLGGIVPKPTSTDGVTGPGTGVTAAPSPTTTSNGLGGFLSSLLDPSSTSGSDIVTLPIPLPTTSLLPGNNGTVTDPTPTDSATITDPTPTDSLSITSTGPPPGPTTTAPPGNGTSTYVPTATGSPTSLPPAYNGTDVSTTTPPTSIPTASLPTGTNGTESIPSVTSLPSYVSTSLPASVTSVPSSATITNAPTVTPTITESGTSMWVPTSIMVAPSAASTGSTVSSLPSALPSTLPKVIASPNGTIAAPEGSTLVQLGFQKPLNWPFVAAHSLSVDQIFQYLPVGLVEGLKLKKEQVVIQSLKPLNTTTQLQYWTTLAMVFIPDNMVDTLALDLRTAVSGIYTNPDASVNQLMNYINPSIPLQPGADLGTGDATGTGVGSLPTSNTGGNNGGLDGSSQKSAPAVKGTTVGIAVSCVGAAAAYGAAMFFIARRYKRKKQTHRRSSSIMSNSEMRQSTGPTLLTGANMMSGGRTSPGEYSYGTNENRHSDGSRGSVPNSARTQQISGPMMAENSLGWN